MYRSIARINLEYADNIIQQWYNFIPYIKPYYAIKAFPEITFLEHIQQYNIGFDCASMGEIELVKNTNNPKIFANPAKSVNDILYAKKYGINDIVIDSIEEIQKIQNIHPFAKYIIRVIGDEMFSTIRFNKKFGAYPEDVESIIKYMTMNNLTLKGFSYHVGSKCSDMIAHTNTINVIINKYLPICYDNGLYPVLIDIGGGFEDEIQLLELNEQLKSNNITDTIDNLNIQMIAEPGRLFCQGVLEIETEIIAIRERNIDKIKTLYITINDSVYHSFQGKIYDGQSFEPIPNYDSGELVRCIIFGQTCDSLDMICDNCILPYPKLGDKLVFKNMGAYSLASANGTFNGFMPALLDV